VTNVTFIFGTSPNTKPEEKKWGDMAYCIPATWKSGVDTSPMSPPNCTHVHSKRKSLFYGNGSQTNKPFYGSRVFCKPGYHPSL